VRFRSRIKEWLYGSCPGFAGSFPYCGTRIYFPRRCRLFQTTCRQGVFERDNVNLLCRLARRGGTVFDIGANIGLMAAPILRNCPNTTVVSFEPSPSTLKYLEKTISISPYRSRWTLVPKAVCDSDGVVHFYTAAAVEMAAFEGLADTTRGGPTRQVTVSATRLDVEWESLGKPTISAIKIDVEGAEMRVLSGAEGCLSAQRPPILLEWNADNLKASAVLPNRILEFAQQTAYSLHSVPQLTRIADDSELRLHMEMTESFLLWPSRPGTTNALPTNI